MVSVLVVCMRLGAAVMSACCSKTTKPTLSTPLSKDTVMVLQGNRPGQPLQLLYEGEFVRGVRHGQGTAYYSQRGEVYTGQWLDGRRTGPGVCTRLQTIQWGAPCLHYSFASASLHNCHTAKGSCIRWRLQHSAAVYVGMFTTCRAGDNLTTSCLRLLLQAS